MGSFIIEVIGAIIVAILGFLSRTIYNNVRSNVFKKVPKKLIEEINNDFRLILNDPNFSIKNVKPEKVSFLPTVKEFFHFRKRMADAIGKADNHILFVGRPILHLLPEEREQLTINLSKSAKAYLNCLNNCLASKIGYFIYFIDPFDTVKQMLSKARYSIKDVGLANKLLLKEIKKHDKRLKVYASPPQAFNKDIIIVNTSTMRHEIVIGHRPLGRKTFEEGIRIKSKLLYDRLMDFIDKTRWLAESNAKQGKDLEYYLNDALQRFENAPTVNEIEAEE